jgi:6-phosphogluconolactonase (cycloisomerase 2 family)
VAQNSTSTVAVYKLGADGAIGAQVGMDVPAGKYPHQVRVDPSGERAFASAKDSGEILVFKLAAGTLADPVVLRPGMGIGPRHLDFHPGKWLFSATEGGNRLLVYDRTALDPTKPPLFNVSTLAGGSANQRAGAIHAHPTGRWVYVSNRNDRQAQENSIAVFAVDEATGAPTRIQNEDCRGIEPRTFALDPGGRFLVSGNQKELGTHKRNLAVFRVGMDGKLTLDRSYPVAGDMLWVGFGR